MVAAPTDLALLLVGDSRLKLNEFAADNRLSQIVTAATRGIPTLGMYFTNRLDFFLNVP
jgi:hypothetical protein